LLNVSVPGVGHHGSRRVMAAAMVMTTMPPPKDIEIISLVAWAASMLGEVTMIASNELDDDNEDDDNIIIDDMLLSLLSYPSSLVISIIIGHRFF
jgi:hypothetical protein